MIQNQPVYSVQVYMLIAHYLHVLYTICTVQVEAISIQDKRAELVSMRRTKMNTCNDTLGRTKVA